MTDWKHTLDITDLHESYQRGDMIIDEVAKEVAKRLRALVTENKPPIEQYLIDQANVIADSLEHEIEVVEQYDNLLNNLYEWADTVMPHGMDVKFSNIPKLCWIKTT